jgi:tetratricopeptide (TPR) repeat protein
MARSDGEGKGTGAGTGAASASASASTALVERDPTAPARAKKADDADEALELAPSLEAAKPRSFVHIDGRGQVRSPARYRALQAISYGAAAAIVGGVTVVYGAIFGPAGVLVGAGLGAWISWHVFRRRKLQKAARFVVNGQLEEAEKLLLDIGRSFRLPRLERALVEQQLGAIAVRRGDYEEALRRQRNAMQIYARSHRLGRRSPFARTVEYAEIVTLVNLGRVGEARQRFEQRREVPEGDYLRVQHWAAELYVLFAEGEHRLSADDLHERSRAALAITSAAALLGLCAWAQLVAGEEDYAWLLLREAYDRVEGTAIDKAMPRLWAWMEAERPHIPPTDV